MLSVWMYLTNKFIISACVFIIGTVTLNLLNFVYVKGAAATTDPGVAVIREQR